MKEYSAPKKMKQIGDLFLKYKKTLKPPQKTVEKACLDKIFIITGFKLNPEQITYTLSTRTVFLKVPSILKSEIKFHYQTILDDLEKELGKANSPKLIQ